MNRVGRKPSSCRLYRCFDAGGRLLYVGVSMHGIARLAVHSAAPWFDDVVLVKVEAHQSMPAALCAERYAIANEHPLHNRLGAAA